MNPSINLDILILPMTFLWLFLESGERESTLQNSSAVRLLKKFLLQLFLTNVNNDEKEPVILNWPVYETIYAMIP